MSGNRIANLFIFTGLYQKVASAVHSRLIKPDTV